jgi:hypothetical protein
VYCTAKEDRFKGDLEHFLKNLEALQPAVSVAELYNGLHAAKLEHRKSFDILLDWLRNRRSSS